MLRHNSAVPWHYRLLAPDRVKNLTMLFFNYWPCANVKWRQSLLLLPKAPIRLILVTHRRLRSFRNTYGLAWQFDWTPRNGSMSILRYFPRRDQIESSLLRQILRVLSQMSVDEALRYFEVLHHIGRSVAKFVFNASIVWTALCRHLIAWLLFESSKRPSLESRGGLRQIFAPLLLL